MLKNVKIFTWGTIFAARSTSTQAVSWRVFVRRLALGSTGVLGGGCGVIYCTSLEDVQISGRRRLMLGTREEEASMGDDASGQLLQMLGKSCIFTQDLDGTPPPPLTEWIKQRPGRGGLFDFLNVSALERWMYHTLLVAQRIVAAVKSSDDLPPGCDTLRWRLHLIRDDETVNAFVLPNGHIFVFSGVMRHVPSIDVLGFLLGHESAHAVLRHGGERASEEPILELAGL